MGAKKKTISTLTLADLALDAPVGESGSKTELVAFAPPPVPAKAGSKPGRRRGRCEIDLRFPQRKEAV